MSRLRTERTNVSLPESVYQAGLRRMTERGYTTFSQYVAQLIREDSELAVAKSHNIDLAALLKQEFSKLNELVNNATAPPKPPPPKTGSNP